MKLVLDTNAVSALMKGDSVFIERLKQQSKEGVGVPQPVLAEIAYGIERLPKSKRREELQERIDLAAGRHGPVGEKCTECRGPGQTGLPWRAG